MNSQHYIFLTKKPHLINILIRTQNKETIQNARRFAENFREKFLKPFSADVIFSQHLVFFPLCGMLNELKIRAIHEKFIIFTEFLLPAQETMILYFK